MPRKAFVLRINEDLWKELRRMAAQELRSVQCTAALFSFEQPTLGEDGWTSTLPGWTPSGSAGNFNPPPGKFSTNDITMETTIVKLSAMIKVS